MALGQGFQKIGDAFEKHHDVNLVRADWKNGFYYGYNAAVIALDFIGRKIAEYLNEKLTRDRAAWRNLTVIGFSLGTHIAGKKVDNTQIQILTSTYYKVMLEGIQNSALGQLLDSTVQVPILKFII